MKRASIEVEGYTTLPLQLPKTPLLTTPATHYLYIRPHEPRIPDPDSSRCLFIVNAPIDTTDAHIRHLFGTQLQAGRVERVSFEDVNLKKSAVAAPESNLSHRNKKRKRVTADEFQSLLDDISFPSTWDRQLQKSGAHAIVMFADKPSMEASLKAATKAAKKGTAIVWGEGLSSDRIPKLGLHRYMAHERLRYPDRAALLRKVNDFMTVFAQVSEARKREESRKTEVADEDGFVTVTHGPKLNSLAREEELKELVERQKKKAEGLEDFYRFQSREKRKERQNALLKRFDEDKKKLRDIKIRRGTIKPDPIVALNKFSNLNPTYHRPITSRDHRGIMSNPTLDSDEDEEFEDVLPPQTSSPAPQRRAWTPTLYLPRQRCEPLRAGSDEETQLRGRLSIGIEKIQYRQMKSEFGMDATDTLVSDQRYKSFQDLALDVEGLVDMLWTSATLEMSLKTYPFDPEPILTTLHKFDAVFAALCKGTHPFSGAPLPGSQTRPLVTQTQKVRIRSLAETTRAAVFASLSSNEDLDGSDEENEETAQPEKPWLMEATRVYDQTLMLLAD
ncbi:Ribosomal RNA-processing protein 7 [Penicillium taxi]|uniref:Ribosomal RNA-processing protein 7 n=1 Tax=Penicillium taxi TaxID=168475 RepID=UPI002545321E|nr:Ribosomal RNA-processing protein 7 [Penicillium taxi]KAJ5895552.1 Ribosomal RNA-processing protein 7 [Penicillium taxi]